MKKKVVDYLNEPIWIADKISYVFKNIGKNIHLSTGQKVKVIRILKGENSFEAVLDGKHYKVSMSKVKI